MFNTLENMYAYYKSKIKNQLTFQGKPIVVDVRNTLEKENTFWHVSSLTKDSVNKSYDFFPCVNHEAIAICKIDCDFEHEDSVVVSVHSQKRLFCVYRCMFINLITEILEKIKNNNLANIKAWEIKNKRRVIIRYEKGAIDYLIILEKTSSTYKLITSYPLFFRDEKEKKEKQYNHFNSKKLI